MVKNHHDATMFNLTTSSDKLQNVSQSLSNVNK